MSNQDQSVEHNPGVPEHSQLDLKTINQRHVHDVDKFYRMFAGAASFIRKFENGVIYLDIHVDNRLTVPIPQITRNIAKSWLIQKELKDAKEYVAYVYKSERPSGFSVSAEDLARHSPSDIAEAIRNIATEYPDVLITTIKGSCKSGAA